MYLVDAFLSLAEGENALAMCAIARSMLELSAFLHEVHARLLVASFTASPTDWRQAGEKFFGLVLRARFATSSSWKRDWLLKEGVPVGRLKPFNIGSCVSGLSSQSGQEDAASRYDQLCDFVHHNLSGAALVNSGDADAHYADLPAGVRVINTNGAMRVTQYEYPASGSNYTDLLDDLAVGFLRDANASVRWLDATPESPYSPELLLSLTGSSSGAIDLRNND
ncbi:hypothetical protein [Actinomycetospora atypica]|uniref:Uncharacterized protein n=1 Tax=Actinomycetospora atypica TaxID=1290095 RepID=A0ABV9YEU6_9PSEU